MGKEDTGFSSHDVNDTTPSIPLTREALYDLVWSEPMLKVAAQYGVSLSYMARVCTLLNVPRPERGYWAKLAVGKTSPKPPLPDAQPGDELVWSRDGETIKVTRPLPRPPSKKPKRKAKPTVVRSDQHPLFNGAKALFESGRLSYAVGYLKPAKRLLVDLIVTTALISPAARTRNSSAARPGPLPRSDKSRHPGSGMKRMTGIE